MKNMKSMKSAKGRKKKQISLWVELLPVGRV